MAFLRLFAGYGGDKQRLIKWAGAGGQAAGDGLSMSIGLGVGNDISMTCDFFSLSKLLTWRTLVPPSKFTSTFLVRFFCFVQYHLTKLPELIHDKIALDKHLMFDKKMQFFRCNMNSALFLRVSL